MISNKNINIVDDRRTSFTRIIVLNIEFGNHHHPLQSRSVLGDGKNHLVELSEDQLTGIRIRPMQENCQLLASPISFAFNWKLAILK